jgi:hypothetical protein
MVIHFQQVSSESFERPTGLAGGSDHRHDIYSAYTDLTTELMVLDKPPAQRHQYRLPL